MSKKHNYPDYYSYEDQCKYNEGRSLGQIDGGLQIKLSDETIKKIKNNPRRGKPFLKGYCEVYESTDFF